MRSLRRMTSAIRREMPRSRHRVISLLSSSEPRPWPLRSERTEQRRLGRGSLHAVRTCHPDDFRVRVVRTGPEDCSHRHSLRRIDLRQLVEKARRDPAERGEEAHL